MIAGFIPRTSDDATRKSKWLTERYNEDGRLIHEEVVMEQRFFVTIFGASRSALADLLKLELDLFGMSAGEEVGARIGGLLTEASIEEVRKAGFRVDVHEEYVEQARQTGKQVPPIETMDDKAWLEEFERRRKEE
jgi:hypothetical protein